LAEARGIGVVELKKTEGFDWGLILRLAAVLRKEKADIVHTHNFAPLIYGTLAAKLAGIPCMNTRHGRAPKKASSLIWALNKYVAVISEDAKKALNENNRINPKKVKLVYNGIDLNRYNGSANNDLKSMKRELGLKEDSCVIGNIGRLVKEKDQTTLLKAFKKLIQKKFNGELVIVGDGPLKEELISLSKEYDIADHVKFLGYQDDIEKYYRLFDIYILSSVSEGISLTLLEAMASGKPVIATKVGGNPEVVVERETGYLVPCGFPERIEQAVMRLNINQALTKEMGVNAKKRVQAHFSLTGMSDQYQKLYEDMLS